MKRDQILFGPAGNADRFYAEGHNATVQAPRWLKQLGLNAMEYSGGHGISMGEATARAIGREAEAAGIAMSLHAPYYINCASPEPERREKSIGYLLESARACDYLGGDRVVFHVGSPGKLRRADANRHARETVRQALKRLDDAGLAHISLCPETMGRESQLGSLEETLKLCSLDERLVPTLDFGHLHAVKQGALKTEADMRRVLDRLVSELGHARAASFHSHFSRIEFTAKGEKRHMTFADAEYGPDFALLAPLLIEYRLTPTLICESRGTQADDAASMMRMVEASTLTGAQDRV